ncbi:MAG TPA: putative glycolipid-binding domain-containing protein [Ohtaekwangia sp.]|nr:putative glycolipid-binding domain-containing protein [Ohtaekwangia sp.]
MQTNILWTGIEYYSLENCIIDLSENKVGVDSAIIGLYNEKIYRVAYTIKLNNLWQVNYCIIKTQFDNRIKTIKFLSNQDKWSLDGKYFPEFDGCTDVDIPLTPFTNSLPINRLKLSEGEAKEIDVIYIDLLEDNIKRVKQKYSRVSAEV